MQDLYHQQYLDKESSRDPNIAALKGIYYQTSLKS